MNCPECGNKTRVIATNYEVGTVMRKRLCMHCDLRFRTYESVDMQWRTQGDGRHGGKRMPLQSGLSRRKINGRTDV